MKGKTDMYKKTVLSLLAVLCAAMTACSAAKDGENTVSDTQSVTATVSVSETTEETTAAETALLEENDEVSEEASIKAEMLRYTDFAFIEYYKGSKQEDEVSEKATELLKTMEEYSQMQKYSDMYKANFSEFFDENGALVPKLHEKYTEDYDNDGKTESFLLVDIPYCNNFDPDNAMEEDFVVFSFLFYADSNGNVEFIDKYSQLYNTMLIDYGYNKQIVIGGSGRYGYEDHTGIFTVRDGKSYQLWGFRGSLAKQDCFLTMYGQTGYGATLWFDPEQLKYIPVDGVSCDIDEIKKMDEGKNITILYQEYDDGYENDMQVKLFGGKYYCVQWSDTDRGDVYTYEDGAFVFDRNSHIRSNLIGDNEYEPMLGTGVLVDFNYDEVVSEMIKVEAKMPSYSVEDIDGYTMEMLKEDYAGFISDASRTYTADDVEVTAFYGIYNGCDAVKMSDNSEVIIYVIYDEIIRGANFVSIDTAYSMGYLTEKNVEQLNSVLENAE